MRLWYTIGRTAILGIPRSKPTSCQVDALHLACGLHDLTIGITPEAHRMLISDSLGWELERKAAVAPCLRPVSCQLRQISSSASLAVESTMIPALSRLFATSNGYQRRSTE